MSDSNQKIRERAHRIWEEQGRPEGLHTEHWLQAESELQEGLDAESGGAGSQLSQTDEAEATAQDAAGELDEGADAEEAARQLGAGAETAAPQSGERGRGGRR
jgi:hypothetical protein